MKFIKRITTTPLPKHEGKIVDSFDAVSDEKRNAPSINAVKNYVANKINELKSYVDNKFNSYKLKGDFAVISGSCQFDGSRSFFTIEYPSGFNCENTAIINVLKTNGNNSYEILNVKGFLDADHIMLIYDYSTSPTTLNYKVVLMKV